jgi:hypothetical protein
VTADRETVFKGETLRGLLLTSYGFSEFGTKAEQAATVAYIATGLLFLLAIAGFVHAFVTPRTKAFALPETESSDPRAGLLNRRPLPRWVPRQRDPSGCPTTKVPSVRIATTTPLSTQELDRIDAYWRAAHRRGPAGGTRVDLGRRVMTTGGRVLAYATVAYGLSRAWWLPPAAAGRTVDIGGWPRRRIGRGRGLIGYESVSIPTRS